MGLTVGAHVGPYEIISPLGAGGMGEVYRARDARLNRDVALKVINPGLVDAEHIARFRREARALAALCHPHVAGVYDLDEVDGRTFLVMELVSGDTLADRIAKGPLSLAETIRLSSQIAAALEAVHHEGIIHRDLKPANIKITTEGVAKVLDFGLAKTGPGDEAVLSQRPTATVGVTREGSTLGTTAYMSPEQLRGWDVDARTDVWSFGCVVYEMLAGRSAFAAATSSDTIAAVLERDPDWSALPASTPPLVRRLLRRCLEKDSKRRMRDIGDVRLDLEDAGLEPLAVAAPAPGNRRALMWTLAALIAGGLVGAAIAGVGTRPRQPAAMSAHFVMPLPVNERFGSLDFPAVAISPDGSLFAYVANRGGQTQLFLRPMNETEAKPIAGTSNASAPFFSPDGTWIAFFADGQLKKVPTSGGAPITLCDARVGVGGSWGADDTIVFAATTGSGLSRVAAAGGRPERVTILDAQRGEFSHRWPDLLPDGKGLVYTSGTVGRWDDAQIVGQSMTTGARTVLIQGGTSARYLSSGHLLYARGGALMAVPFDAGNMKVTGTPVRILDNVAQSFDGAAQVSISRTGSVVYLAGRFESSEHQLAAVDRSGTATPFAAPPRPYASPRWSPDGRRILVTIEDPSSDLWIYDITPGTLTQLTFDAAGAFPVWNPDGGHVAYSSPRGGGAPNLFWTEIAQGRPERLATSENPQVPGSWSSDGNLLAFAERRPTSGRDIWLLDVRDRTRRPIADSTFDESAPRLSPNGRWMAYVSNQSGRNEVYLRAIGDRARERVVSIGGGTEPVWSRDGRELFYRDANRMMAVSMTAAGADVDAGRPQMLFDAEFVKGTAEAANYDISPDRQRFVMVHASSASAAQPTMHVLLNWPATVDKPPAPSR